MSIWTDIHRRSIGDTISKEDFHQIYNDEIDGTELLYTEEYKGCTLEVHTNGMYPWIDLIFKSGLSSFSGKDLVRLKDEDGKYYNLDRFFDGTRTRFSFWFNRDEDYVAGNPESHYSVTKPHDGIKYTLEDLKVIAKKFTDLLIQCEKDLSYME